MNNKTMTTKAEKLSRLIPKEGGEEVPNAAAQISRCDGLLPVTHTGGGDKEVRHNALSAT